MPETNGQPAPDPLLDEIRAVKQSVSARFGHDVRKLCDHLRAQQKRSGRRVIRQRRAQATADNARR